MSYRLRRTEDRWHLMGPSSVYEVTVEVVIGQVHGGPGAWLLNTEGAPLSGGDAENVERQLDELPVGPVPTRRQAVAARLPRRRGHAARAG